jgi:formaldehyde dismutase / methanol dehydrogenase
MLDKKIFEFPILYTLPMGKIAIGWGVHETVADECKEAKIKKALITTTGLKGTGIVDEIKGILNHHGIATEVFDKVTSNPKDYEVMEAYQVFKETQCDGVVSIGGGSSHDAGKGVRAVACNNGIYVCDMAMFIDPPWMEERKKYNPVTIPQVSVNTTAGTGAESSTGASIVNTSARAKQLLFLPGQTANAALIDPLLVRLMPSNMTAWTGMDALTHAYESYISRIPSDYTAALMLRAIKLVSKNLREFTYNRMNHNACINMCRASSIAAVGMQLGSGPGIVHGLAHTLSVLTGCHHGLANAVFTLVGERYNQPTCPEKFGEMAAAMEVDTRGMTIMQGSDKWFEEIEELLIDLGIQPGSLGKQFGLQKEDFGHMVDVYSNDFCSQSNPRGFNRNECMSILETLF